MKTRTKILKLSLAQAIVEKLWIEGILTKEQKDKIEEKNIQKAFNK